MAPAAELETVERRVAEATRAVELAAWRADVQGARAGDDAAVVALAAIAADARLAERLAAWAEDGDPRAAMLAARLARVRLGGVGPSVPAALAEPAREASWLLCLRGNVDPARRATAWRARTATAEPVAERLLACVRARRRVPGYEDVLLAAHALAWPDVERLAGAVAHASDATWQAARAARDGHAPWDLHLWPGGEAARAPIVHALAARGAYAAIADADAALGFAPGAFARVDVPLAGAGATTYFVDPPLDVRVVADEPGGEWSDWRRLVHELGHARYAAGHAPALPWSLRDAPAPWLHEAVAQSFVRRAERAGWLERHAHVPAALARTLAAHAAFERLLETRLRLCHVAFEHALLDPDGPDDVAGLTARWWQLVERFVGVTVEGADARLPAWARVPHFARRPGSAAVYLAADVAAGPLAAETVDAAWLAEHVFASGALAPLPPLVPPTETSL